MNWMNGFTIGLCLGTALFSTVIALRRRHLTQTLQGLLQAGTYRVLKADGSSVAPDELFAALGLGPRQTPVGKGKVVTLFAVGVVAGLLAMYAVSR
jgi:hypothetical protein